MSEFEKLYTVEDIAQMTMLTTRTIRNYLKDGLLTGRKVGGQWRFTGKDIEGLFENSSVEEDMKNTRRQDVMDFINGINTDIEGDIQICTIVDYYCSDAGIARDFSTRFSDVINSQNLAATQRFYYEYIEKEQKARYTFFGTPMFIKTAVIIIEEEWARLNGSLSKFTDKAKNYAQYRPSYPKEAIDLILATPGKEELSIADIGSGTGKMSALLLERGHTVYAVEPNEDMRKEAVLFLEDNKNFHSVNGTAENTTLKANSVDLIVCAEAYHWFDNQKTVLEFMRILKPQGYVFLLWNSPGDNVYGTEMGELYNNFCKQNASEVISVSKEERAIHLFGKNHFRKAEFENDIYQPHEAFQGGQLSASYAPKPEDSNYEEYLIGVKNLFDSYCKDGLIETKFITVCYYGKLSE